MKTWKKIVLLVGILLLAFGLTVLQIARHRGESFAVLPTRFGSGSTGSLSYDQKDYTVCRSGEERFSAKDVRSLDLNWLSGSVNVERYDGRDLLVRETASVSLREDECLRWRLRDGELSILPCANKARSLPVKQLTVLIPQDLTLERLKADSASAAVVIRGVDAADRLSLHSASGSLRAEDCRGGELRLDSASGSQSILRCELRGEVEADLASGSFTADALSCSVLDVEGASGSQRFSELECGKLRVSSASGSVRGEELRVGDARVDGGSGSVELDFIAAPERVKVDTASGSVKLAFPRGTGLDLDYDSSSGKLKGEVVYGDLPVEVDTSSGSLTIEYRD